VLKPLPAVDSNVGMQYAYGWARATNWMEAAMFELSVYYHDVLRYKIVANMDKVCELRSQGFYVQVKPVPGRG
jgi:hypothetical protein